MKKKSLLLLGVGMLALYSCNSGNQNAAAQQAQADSIANAAKVQAAAAAQAKQDSVVNAANMETMKAQAQADSLKGAMVQKDKEGATTVTRTVTTSHHHSGARETEQPAPTIGNGKPVMGNNPNNNTQKSTNTIGNGKPKMGN